MQTKKVLNMAIITLGIYYTYLATLSLLSKFGSLSISGTEKSIIDLFTFFMSIVVLAIGLLLITKPVIITRSVKFKEDDPNIAIDLSAIEQVILKIVSILLIMYNVQVIFFQAATLYEYSLIGGFEDHRMWMIIDIFVRLILVLVGVIVFWKSYIISKFIFKDR